MLTKHFKTFLLVLLIAAGISGTSRAEYPRFGARQPTEQADFLDNLKAVQSLPLLGVGTSTFQLMPKSTGFDANDKPNNWIKHLQNNVEDGGLKYVCSMPETPPLREYYEMNIDKIVALNLNSWRMTIEWTQIEPEQGVYDKKAIADYHYVFDLLTSRGISPIVTLYHWTHPHWWEKKGEWSKKENTKDIARFAARMTQEFKDKVDYWITLNEPGVITYMGNMFGHHSPGVKNNLWRAAHVCRNLMKAHTEMYKAIKAGDGGEKLKVGIVHNPFKMHTIGNEAWYNPLKQGFKLWVRNFNSLKHGAIMTFLKTGKFRYGWPQGILDYMPDCACITYEAEGTILDFIGLNYYSELDLGMTKPSRLEEVHSFAGPRYQEDDIVTNYKYPLNPEGFYQGLLEFSELGVPIIITENGHCNDMRPGLQKLWIQMYFYALGRAIREGIPVIGYLYWTFHDCLEWNKFYEVMFGLYHANYDDGKMELTLREGGKYLAEIYGEAAKLRAAGQNAPLLVSKL